MAMSIECNPCMICGKQAVDHREMCAACFVVFKRHINGSQCMVCQTNPPVYNKGICVSCEQLCHETRAEAIAKMSFQIHQQQQRQIQRTQRAVEEKRCVFFQFCRHQAVIGFNMCSDCFTAHTMRLRTGKCFCNNIAVSGQSLCYVHFQQYFGQQVPRPTTQRRVIQTVVPSVHHIATTSHTDYDDCDDYDEELTDAERAEVGVMDCFDPDD